MGAEAGGVAGVGEAGFADEVELLGRDGSGRMLRFFSDKVS